MSEVGANRPKKPKTGGRAAGTPNKTTRELKDMILKALDESGGVKYLVGVAEREPKAFCALLGRVLPLQVSGESGGPLQISISPSMAKW